MAVREFRDDSGRKWRAWAIKPEEIHPVTKAEDYLADCYVTGWIVFETVSGDEKRRLCPWPMNWAERSDDQLRELLRRADPVSAFRVKEDRVPREQSIPRHPAESEIGEHKPDLTDLDVIRTFRYPGGRVWTVCVVAFPEQGGPALLRFQSGLRIIDMRTWPKDWADKPDDELVWMLRRAAPRKPTPSTGTDVPRRRWDDPQSLTT